MQDSDQDPTPPLPQAPETPRASNPIEPTSEPLPIVDHPTLEAPKKPRKKLVIIIVAVLVVIAFGVIAYFLFKPAPPTKQAQTTTTKTDTKPAEEKNVTLDSIKADLTDQLGGTLSEPTNYNAPEYKISGSNYYSQADEGTKPMVLLSTVKTLTEAKDDVSVTAKVLKNSGLTISKTYGDVNDEDYGAYWLSDDFVCDVEMLGTGEAATRTYDTSINCASTGDYAKAAKILKPFYDAYSQSADYNPDTYLSIPVSKGSKTSGYDTAQGSIGGGFGARVGGAATLFYKTPDGVWHYFAATQSEMLCSAYKTDDLKKAYLGETCYDNVTETDKTVSL